MINRRFPIAAEHISLFTRSERMPSERILDIDSAQRPVPFALLQHKYLWDADCQHAKYVCTDGGISTCMLSAKASISTVCENRANHDSRAALKIRSSSLGRRTSSPVWARPCRSRAPGSPRVWGFGIEACARLARGLPRWAGESEELQLSWACRNNRRKLEQARCYGTEAWPAGGPSPKYLTDKNWREGGLEQHAREAAAFENRDGRVGRGFAGNGRNRVRDECKRKQTS